MTEPKVVELLKQLCRPSGGGHDLKWKSDMYRLLESGKQVLVAEAERLLEEAGDLPVLMAYSSDGTLVPTVHNVPFLNPQAGQRRRRSKKVTGVLVEQVFLRYLGIGGGVYSAVLLREPTPLFHGKAGNAVWACGIAFAPLIRGQ